MQKRSTLLFSLMVFVMSGLFAQQQTAVDIGLRYIEEHTEEWKLTTDDYKDVIVSDMYKSRHNGVTHLYLNQQIDGIPINQSIINLTIDKNGKVAYAVNGFISDAASKVKTNTIDIEAAAAIVSSATEMGVVGPEVPTILTKTSNSEMVFAQTSFTNSDIPVKTVYQENELGELVLCWDFTFDMKANSDYWKIRVDGSNGTIVNKQNLTVYCKHEKGAYHNHTNNCSATKLANHQPAAMDVQTANMVLADATYNVFPLPIESPNHGPQQLVEDPAILSASPFGWHDADGMVGAEYTITRGNNVWAYLDRDANDSSDGGEPDGGPELNFDYTFDPLAQPIDQGELAQVNLFYMVNMMHDISYTLGFTEEAGNFQSNNYGNGGQDNDFVLAEAQDGEGTNNANFRTPTDGSNGVIQMFLWDNTGGILKITAPSQLEGFYDAGTADFGPQILSENLDVEAEVAIVTDGSAAGGGNFGDGCSETTSDVMGKIALVNRGSCDFSHKVYYANQAGAVAVIICNIPGATTAGDDGNNTINMTGVDFVNDITVPSLFVYKSTCDAVKLSLEAGIPVTMHIKNHEVAGPDFYDGDFDNGIIAHEFGHGISTRLTGGPSQGCLGGSEQMGEGWSDFFTLITSVQPGDEGSDIRGIGTFAAAQSPGGVGIRSYPYSTDMSINPQTYDDIKAAGIDANGNVIPHDVGEVWCAMIWDLYWAFVGEYGWSADWDDQTSGNYMASLLVMDGMKLQGCFPGFIEGRNAILAADQVNYNGMHQCLIWEVFARRGLGFFAQGGASSDHTDGSEDFETRPLCLEELKINKTMASLIEPESETDVFLTVTNHIPAVTEGVVVTDEIPDGLTYVDGSASMPATASGNTITFDIGDMAFEDVVNITYKVLSNDDASSSLLLKDMEDFNADGFFTIDVLETNTNIWQVTTLESNSGEASWLVESTDTESDQVIYSQPFGVSGVKPTLRFFHKFNTEAIADAGFLQLSTDGGVEWNNFDDADFVFEGYNNVIQYGTLATPNLNGFSGTQDDWSPIYIDLSAYNGQDIQIRFRFATDDNTNVGGNLTGWIVDDMELLDLLAYSSVACATSTNDAVPEVCTDAVQTVINSKETSSVVQTEKGDIELKIFPNPASDLLNVAITSSFNETGNIAIYTLDGRQLSSQNIEIHNAERVLQIDVSELPGGFYVLKMETPVGQTAQKITIH